MEKITKSSDKVLIDPNEPLILPDGTALVGRVEWFLYALCCLDYQNLPTPMSRIEEFANALITGEIPNIQPQSRAEQFFLAILDGNISDLPQPQSRSEVLLDKLARGEFDLSDVEPIQSRYELLLAYLIKNGGIGNIDYVLYEFSEAMKTMYNTVEKPFKSLELSGNTLVNCVLEDTENDDYTSFDKDYSGTSFTINGTSEGAIKSAILSGNTLVNLAKYELSTSSSEILCYQDDNLQKNNTVYTLVNLTDKQITFNTYANSSWRGFETVEANSKRLLTLNDFTINEVIGRTANGWDKTTETKKFLKGYMIIEGDYTNVDIPFFEGMQSVKNSQTLVNLLKVNKDNYIINQPQNWSIEDGYFKCVSSTSWHTITDRFNNMIKPSTKYLIVVEIKENTLDIDVIFDSYGTVLNSSTTYLSFNSNEVGIKKAVITTPSTIDSTKNGLFRMPINVPNEGSILKFRVMAIPYQDGMENWDIPYFEGMQSVKLPVLKVTGKNLFDKSKVKYNTTLNPQNGKEESYNLYMISDFINVEPNKNYVSSHMGVIFYYDENKKFISMFDSPALPRKFTTPNNCKYVRFRSWEQYNTIEKQREIVELEQFEEGSIATSYEPYKSNILTVNEEVTLRGIGDVKDELNCLTGEVTERIGEIVLNEDITGYLDTNYSVNGYSAFRVTSITNIPNALRNVICDKVKYYPNFGLDWTKQEEFFTTNGNLLFVKILSTKASNFEELRTFLSSSPITIQYELAESIKTVDLNVVDQNNTKIDKIHVFNETTHVNASSDELTPTVNIGKSVSYPTIIKPNTKYTVDLKRNDKPLTVNLGGTEVTFASGETRKTITTPSTLTNDKLSYYGVGAKCNEIMLIEGEIERNIDYFTGMQSVVMQNQMPILSTVGKNLFNPLDLIISESQRVTCVAEPNRLSFRYKIGSHFNSSSYIQLEPNTKYWITITTKSYNKSEDEYVKLHLGKRPHHDSTEYGGFFIKASTDGTQYRSFTTDSDAKLYINGYVGSVGYDIWDIMLEKVEDSNASATPYEPYKTSILSLPQEVVLRSLPNGVCDTLDTQTGIYTKRIGEISTDDVINNTTWSKADGLLTSNNIAFYYQENNIKTTFGGSEGLGVIVSDVLPYTNRDSLMQDIEGIATSNKNIIFKILKSKLPSSLSVDDFKRWLKANPITIQYELANPIIKTVDLNVVDQDGNTIPKIKSYKDVTHLEITVPKQSLLPHISAEVATDNSKDMSSLTTKHQEISEAQSTIEDNIQSQSDEIDTALMATTEIFESILE